MRLPNYKRVLTTDFDQENQDLVEQLGESLNPGIESLYQALNKRLTIGDNFQATENDVILSVFSNGNVRNETFVNIDFGTTVRTVSIGKLENLTTPGIWPTSAPYIFWENTPTGIKVLNVTGLTPGISYKLRLVMYG